MAKFGMYVYCKKGGISRDSGLQIEFEANSLEEAQTSPKIQEELKYLYTHYDSVTYEIHPIEENL